MQTKHPAPRRGAFFAQVRDSFPSKCLAIAGCVRYNIGYIAGFVRRKTIWIYETGGKTMKKTRRFLCLLLTLVLALSLCAIPAAAADTQTR